MLEQDSFELRSAFMLLYLPFFLNIINLLHNPGYIINRQDGLTREYPVTPKVILKRVATWLRTGIPSCLSVKIKTFVLTFVI